MLLHDFTQSHHESSGIIMGKNTAIQHHKCRKCGLTIALPDCGKRLCVTLMSLNCSNAHPPKAKWMAPLPPLKSKDVDKKDYPAKRRK